MAERSRSRDRSRSRSRDRTSPYVPLDPSVEIPNKRERDIFRAVAAKYLSLLTVSAPGEVTAHTMELLRELVHNHKRPSVMRGLDYNTVDLPPYASDLRAIMLANLELYRDPPHGVDPQKESIDKLNERFVAFELEGTRQFEEKQRRNHLFFKHHTTAQQKFSDRLGNPDWERQSVLNRNELYERRPDLRIGGSRKQGKSKRMKGKSKGKTKRM